VSEVWYCVAPVVTSWNQTEVVFWAADTGCCSKSGVTCWLKFNSPGFAAIAGRASLNAHLSSREPFESARLKSCSNLAVNTSRSVQDVCSLPAVYLDIASTKTPEETVNYDMFCGLLFTSLFAFTWPCQVYLVAYMNWVAKSSHG
jgi:hypothetical protein